MLSCGVVIFKDVTQINSATSWTTHIFVNDLKSGSISAGRDCIENGETDYSISIDSEVPDKWDAMPFPDDLSTLTACPEKGYEFVEWRVNGASVSMSPTIDKSAEYIEFDTTTNSIDIEAVFAEINEDLVENKEASNKKAGASEGESPPQLRASPYSVTVSVYDSNEGALRIASDTDYSAYPDNQNASSVSINSTSDSTTVSIRVAPASGYALRSSGISTTGGASYNGDLADNVFSLTVTGAGTVSVDFAVSRTATFSVNDSTYGDLVYQGDSNWGWSDLNCSSSTHVTTQTFGEIEINDLEWNTTEARIDLPYHNIYACPKDGATFIGWKINGVDVVDPLNELYVINRNGFSPEGVSLKPLFVDANNITVEAVFYYDVEFKTYPAGAGDLRINNTSNYYIADPDGSRTNDIKLYVDPSQASVTTNSLIVRNLESDYSFDHFDYETGNVSVHAQTQSGYTFDLTGPDTINIVLTSTHRINYSTTDPNITIVEPGTTNAKSYDSIGSLDDDPTGVDVIVDPSVAGRYKLMWWEDENGNAVGVENPFVPTGSLIRDGATYKPVYDSTGRKRSSVTANIPSAGHFRYWSNSQGRWMDTATGAGLVLGVSSGDHFASNIYAVSDDPDYVFDHWDIIFPSGHVGVFPESTCTEQGIDQANCLDASQNVYGDNDHYHIVAVFKKQDIVYESNPIPHARGAKGTIYEPYTSNVKSDDPVVNPTGAEARSTNNYYFMYWSDEDGNIVSYNEIFVPTGNQIQAGAVYYANFCGSEYTCIIFTVNHNAMGYVNENARGDVTEYTGNTPIEFDCDSSGCSPHTTFTAVSKDIEQYFFHHWEISDDGENFDVINDQTLGAALHPSIKLGISPGQRYIIKAIFTDCETLCFHDYSHLASSPYDAQSWGTIELIRDGNNDVIGARAVPRQISNNPYFAYWITGCESDINQDFAYERIVSLDPEYIPTQEELAICSDYVAFFFRSNESRMAVTTNYPHDSRMQVLVQNDGETGRIATNYVNMGLRRDATNHPGLASVYRDMEALAPPGYRFAYWTINGVPLVNTDGNEITDAFIKRSSNADSTSSNIPWFTPLSGQLNVLTAYFVPIIPFTGSFTIWLVLGGGVSMVAIPSIILIINERKEQKKGGKR